MDLKARARYWKSRLLEVDPLAPDACVKVHPILDEWLAELSTARPVGKENRLPSSEIWAETQDLLSRGWLQNRARMKPRGYAGDYELFARICDGTLCDDPWGKVFDEYFQKQAAPIAVRARTWYVGDRITEIVRNTREPVRIVIVGAGPAYDVRLACRRLSLLEHRQLDVLLLDIDPDALDFARETLSECLTEKQIHLERCNLFRLPRWPEIAAKIAEADFISCTGLFDYLEDPQSIEMLDFFHRSLQPGGRGIVFHMSPANPTRAYMEWIANWYLNYRAADEFAGLARAAGIPLASGIGSQVEGLSLCLDWTKS